MIKQKNVLNTFTLSLGKKLKNFLRAVILFWTMDAVLVQHPVNSPIKSKRFMPSKMIEIAKEKAFFNKVENVNFEQTDIFDQRFGKESFDTILAFNMLHTVPTPQVVMQRIHELLKPDGLFISITPCLRDKMSFLVRTQILLVQVLCKIGIIPIAIRRHKSSELDNLMANGNFHAIHTEKIFKGATSYYMVAKKTAEI